MKEKSFCETFMWSLIFKKKYVIRSELRKNKYCLRIFSIFMCFCHALIAVDCYESIYELIHFKKSLQNVPPNTKSFTNFNFDGLTIVFDALASPRRSTVISRFLTQNSSPPVMSFHLLSYGGTLLTHSLDLWPSTNKNSAGFSKQTFYLDTKSDTSNKTIFTKIDVNLARMRCESTVCDHLWRASSS